MSYVFNPFTGKLDATGSTEAGTNIETIIFALTAPEVNIALDAEILAINAFPYAMTITSVRLDVAVAPTGSTLIVDMKKNGSTMMTTEFSVDADEFSSTTADAPPVLSSSTLAVGDKLSFSVDQIGATIPGQYAVVTITGERT
jgi:hypothetical protein